MLIKKLKLHWNQHYIMTKHILNEEYYENLKRNKKDTFRT